MIALNLRAHGCARWAGATAVYRALMLASPADFEAAVRQRHGRKAGIWGLVG